MSDIVVAVQPVADSVENDWGQRAYRVWMIVPPGDPAYEGTYESSSAGDAVDRFLSAVQGMQTLMFISPPLPKADPETSPTDPLPPPP